VTTATIDSNLTDGLAQVRASIAEIGATFDEHIFGRTRALYTPFVQQQPRDSVLLTEDLAFGPDPRQTLDVYQPRGRHQAPVLVYVPGGGFVRGSKNVDGAFYGNLGIYFARHGWLTIVTNYRLAPEHPWPAGAADVAAALAWARAYAARYGGDLATFVLMGQSAGATHAAQVLFDPGFDASCVRAGILLSGQYRFETTRQPNLLAYLGEDASLYPARSPLTHIAHNHVSVLLGVAEFDPGFLAEPTFELAAALTRRDSRPPPVLFMHGHNHVSSVLSLGSGQDDVGVQIRRFLADVGTT
jgi:triacylglycerol lipase